MAAFAEGSTQILVATTVIEVGVDIPQATIMVIEHAERFGLAQLHQLRGRVGRGGANAFCLLLYKAPLGESAKARIAIMRETEDGFRIAEEDLRCAGKARCSAQDNPACRGSPRRSRRAWILANARARRSAANRRRESPARRRPRRSIAVAPQHFRAGEAIRLLGRGRGVYEAPKSYT